MEKVKNAASSQSMLDMAVELLVREGVFLSEEIDRLRERLQQVKENIEGYFPAQKTMEQITTSSGIVTRRVKNKWSVDQKKIKEIRTIVGNMEKEFLCEIIEWKPTAKLRSVCLDADSQIGRELKRYVYIDQTISIAFSKLEPVDEAPREKAEDEDEGNVA